MTPRQRIQALLHSLYPQYAAEMFASLENLLEDFSSRHPRIRDREFAFTEKDSVLITYADQIQSTNASDLDALTDFILANIGGSISTIHLLPFFPYSSDDGFSVIDYTRVNPEVGDWTDIARLGEKYHLMFDFVLNHISRSSEWFQEYQAGNPRYSEYFIAVDPDTDLTSVVRPRALPLLTAVSTAGGVRHLWTTFSSDQIDLNYANPQLALEMIKVLLEYVSRGADILRMDAIAYLWKEIGTSSIHLPQTHLFVKLLRAVLDEVAPAVVLITETNVPHQENISYFGDPLDTPEDNSTTQRSDEAQMVYQFSLAPLVLHTLLHADCTVLSDWAAGLSTPVGMNTYFNFIASHDGIGVRPAEGLLQPEEIQALADRTLAHGGQVSFRANTDGSQSPYELNITLYDFVNDPQAAHTKKHLDRFIASQAIMLSLAGVPGIYFHSLLGSSNCQSCLEETGRARSLNREKFTVEQVSIMLAGANNRAARILAKYKQLLDLRRTTPAFSPYAHQKILSARPEVFCLFRRDANTQSQLLALINVADRLVAHDLDLNIINGTGTQTWRDLITGSKFPVTNGVLHIELTPYQVLWLQPLLTTQNIYLQEG